MHSRAGSFSQSLRRRKRKSKRQARVTSRMSARWLDADVHRLQQLRTIAGSGWIPAYLNSSPTMGSGNRRRREREGREEGTRFRIPRLWPAAPAMHLRQIRPEKHLFAVTNEIASFAFRSLWEATTLRTLRARIVKSGFSECGETVLESDGSAFLARLATNLVECSSWMLVNDEQNGWPLRYPRIEPCFGFNRFVAFRENRTKAVRHEFTNEVLMQSAEIARLHTIARCTIVSQLCSTQICCFPIFTLFHDNSARRFTLPILKEHRWNYAQTMRGLYADNAWTSSQREIVLTINAET